MVSAKDGFGRRLHVEDVELLERQQSRYVAVGLLRSYGAALIIKQKGLHPKQLKDRLSDGMTQGEAMALAELSDDPIAPYVTQKRGERAKVLRLHRVDPSSGVSLPGSNVKVADCSPALDLLKISQPFAREQCMPLLHTLHEFVELKLIADPYLTD